MLDFWLVSVYTELDIKGNLFSSRNLMLQAIRNNSNSPLFYVEYFRFEAVFLQKVKQRREILHSDKNDGSLSFVEQPEEEKSKDESVSMDTSERILEIVLDQINAKFGDNLLVYVSIWKNIVKNNKYIH